MEDIRQALFCTRRISWFDQGILGFPQLSRADHVQVNQGFAGYGNGSFHSRSASEIPITWVPLGASSRRWSYRLHSRWCSDVAGFQHYRRAHGLYCSNNGRFCWKFPRGHLHHQSRYNSGHPSQSHHLFPLIFFFSSSTQTLDFTFQTEMLFCSTVVGLPFLIPPMIITGELFTAWKSCSYHPYVYAVLVFEAMATFVGQISVLSLIAIFGAATTAMVYLMRILHTHAIIPRFSDFIIPSTCRWRRQGRRWRFCSRIWSSPNRLRNNTPPDCY